MKKIVLMGGTQRAVNTLEVLLKRTDLEFTFGIFMPGHVGDRVHVEKLQQLATSREIPHLITDKINAEITQQIQAMNYDAIIGIGVWRSLLTKEFLRSTRLGFLAVHGSPLPKYRGFAGIFWQIINGEDRLGLRAYQLGNGIDDGPLIVDRNGTMVEDYIDLQNEWHLSEILSVYEQKHIRLLNKILDLVRDEEIDFVDQNHAEASYSCHRDPEDGEINWNDSTKNVFNFIRAQAYPLDGAFTYVRDSKVSLMRVIQRPDFLNYVGRIPGKIVSRNLARGSVIILTADGAIEVLETKQDGNEVKPVEIFDSIRERCQTKTEVTSLVFNEFIKKFES